MEMRHSLRTVSGGYSFSSVSFRLGSVEDSDPLPLSGLHEAGEGVLCFEEKASPLENC